MCLTIKIMQILSSIAQLAFATKTTSPMWLWSVMQSHVTNCAHDGKFSKQILHTIVSQSTTITKRTLSRWIIAGDGIYWHTDNKKIYMRSSKRVAAALTKQLPDDAATMNYSHMDAVTIPVAKFASHAERTAWLYWSLFAARKTVTMARATITELTGLSAHQQRAYETILGDSMRITTNYAYADHDRHDSEKIFRYRRVDHAYSIQTKRTDYHGNQYTELATFWQLPNTYHVSSEHKHHNRRTMRQIASIIKSTRQSIAECTYRRVYAVREQYLRADDTITEGYVLKYFNGSKRLWVAGELH